MHRKRSLKNPKLHEALKENELEYQIARAIIEARIKHKMTQTDLARKLNTKQSVISRVENAKTMPSLGFLKKVAEVFDTTLKVQFR